MKWNNWLRMNLAYSILVLNKLVQQSVMDISIEIFQNTLSYDAAIPLLPSYI